MQTWFGGIEAGGTKFVCAVGDGPDNILAETRFPTTTPTETIGRAIEFFRDQSREAPIAAIGIASFGPVDLHIGSQTFGYITTTPKPGWANTSFAGTVEQALKVPVAFDTDVNVAAFGERAWGAAQSLDNFIYLTVGTGIGGGGLVNGKLMHGLIHPEMGHIHIPHDREKDPFPGICPYHGDCFEGLACGPAIDRRWGQPAESLSPEHPAWDLEVTYLAEALVNFICTLSPERIIIGGGVSQQPHLFPRVRQQVRLLLNGYIVSPAIQEELDQYIVPPALGKRAGVLGAIALGRASFTGSHDIIFLRNNL